MSEYPSTISAKDMSQWIAELAHKENLSPLEADVPLRFLAKLFSLSRTQLSPGSCLFDFTPGATDDSSPE